MKTLYIVHEFETTTLYEGRDFVETKLAVKFNDNKIYKAQLDDLAVLDKEVVVLTFNACKMVYYRKMIRDFYDNYHTKLKGT